jgi:hypothetical protein
LALHPGEVLQAGSPRFEFATAHPTTAGSTS